MCPNKDNPQVRERANSKMRRIFGDRTKYQKKRPADSLLSELLSPQENQANWHDYGFKSKEQALLVCTLIARKTGKLTRARILIKKDKENKSHDQGPLNLISIPMVLQSTPQLIVNLNITRYLPHVKLPLRIGTENFTMTTAIDTCAGVNIGELKFHQGVAALYPNSIVDFTDLTETGQDFMIGGVGEGNGLTITHSITYRMPAQVNGSEARLTFGLSKDAVVSALVGISFLKLTRSVVSFSNPDKPALIMQRLNVNLPVTFEAPSVRPIPI